MSYKFVCILIILRVVICYSLYLLEELYTQNYKPALRTIYRIYAQNHFYSPFLISILYHWKLQLYLVVDKKELLQSRLAFVKVNQNQLGVLRVQQRSKLEFTKNKSINLWNKQAEMQIFNERCRTKIHLLGITKIRSIGTHPEVFLKD